MAANKPESSPKAPRTRRRLKKDSEDLEIVEKTPAPDDAADVIFEEGDDAEAPKPRRKKAATRRRKVEPEAIAPSPAPIEDIEISFPEEVEAPAPIRAPRREMPRRLHAADEREREFDRDRELHREPRAEAHQAEPEIQPQRDEDGPRQSEPSNDEFGGPRRRAPRGRGRPNPLRDRAYNPEERVERFEQDDFHTKNDGSALEEVRDFDPVDDDFEPGDGPEGQGDQDGPDGDGEFGAPRRRRRRRRRRRGGRGEFIEGTNNNYGAAPNYQDGGQNFRGSNQQDNGPPPRGPNQYEGGGGYRPSNQNNQYESGQGYRGPSQYDSGPGYRGQNQQYDGGSNQRGPSQQGNNQRGEYNDRRDRRGPPGNRQPLGQSRRRERERPPQRTRSALPPGDVVEGEFDGVLELHPKGYGFLRDPKKNYVAQESDPFVPSSFIEKNLLREGVLLKAIVGSGIRNQGPRLKEIITVEGLSIEDYQKRKSFDELTAITPYRQIKLEIGPKPLTMRVMDLVTPVGKGQRALIVAPPRTGKTMLLQDIADSVSANHPEMHLMVLLIDERPEEVTEMRRKVKGEVIASSMDREVESHVRMSQLIIERGKRLAENGQDVFILMDSITRMARAFNKWSGGGSAHESRTMTGGLHVKALDIPKRLFGTARQFDEGGSLTIVATALIDTGSKMDEVIFQEFKGTGNMELVLSRDLADRRIWPAIDITRSGTRHEEKLYAPEILDSVVMLRRSLISLSPTEAMEHLTRTLDKFPTNREFLKKVQSLL